jgi:hypothetical protein
MRIARIQHINDFRIYQNWCQPKNTDFHRFNVIYGENGSGKSTLVSLLSALASGDWGSGAKLKIESDDRQGRRSISGPDGALASRLCVFNADYVRENLRFDSSRPKSLLFLGKDSIEAQSQRDELEAAISEANDTTIPELKSQLEEVEKQRDKIGTQGARSVSSKLQGIDDKYDGRRYTRRQFSSALDRALQQPPEDMSEFDVVQQVRRVDSPPGDKVNLFPRLGVPLNDLTTLVRAILARTVTSEAIELLRSNHEGAKWVQEGMRLHQAGDRCLFCEGVYTEQRVDRLNRHFDESLKQAQREIEALDARIVEYEEKCNHYEQSLVPPGALDEGRTKLWSDLVGSIHDNIVAVKDYLDFLHQELDRKRERLFQSLALNSSGVDSVPSDEVSIEVLNKIICDHNNDIDNYDNLKKQICDDVVQYYVWSSLEDYRSSFERSRIINEELRVVEQRRDDAQMALQRLNSGREDRAHFASLLTEDMRRYFGRDELTFELYDGDAYSILRNGQKAENLSEGEQRSIALLYFLRDIESNGATLRERIVIFDDPVSSVDDGAATGAFAYIWEKCVGKKQDGVGQLFVFTHNFNFFRFWLNRLNGLKQMSRDGDNLVSYSAFELRTMVCESRKGDSIRVPHLVRWPKAWMYTLLRSEYHYLFWRAAKELMRSNQSSGSSSGMPADIFSEYDAAIMPNVCRRLLEGFLSFRCPKNIGNFEAQMKEIFDQSKGGAERGHIVRFVHDYSHNEQCDTSKPLQLSETRTVLHAIFSLIKDVDDRHYSAMCDALNVSPLGG